jgi:hypothetical protein
MSISTKIHLGDSPLHLSKANREASENKAMQNTHHNESSRKVLQQFGDK